MTNVIDLDEERRKRGLSLPKPVPVIDEEWDDDVPVFDRGLLWGTLIDDAMAKFPITRAILAQHEAQGDPGDETDF